MSVEAALQRHRGLVVLGSAMVPVLVCVVLSSFRDSVANTSAALGLVLVVVAAASTGIRVAGLMAAVTGALAFDYLLTEPYGTITISAPVDIETAALLILVGLAVTELALWGRRQQAEASRDQGYLEGVLSTGALVAAGGSSPETLAERVAVQIVGLLQIDGCRFDPSTQFGLPTIEEDGGVLRNGHRIDVLRRGLPTDSVISLPVRTGGITYGHFLLTAATRVARPSDQQCRIAVSLASQVGAALAARDTNNQKASRPARGVDSAGPHRPQRGFGSAALLPDPDHAPNNG